jgi:hypothetical protein
LEFDESLVKFPLPSMLSKSELVSFSEIDVIVKGERGEERMAEEMWMRGVVASIWCRSSPDKLENGIVEVAVVESEAGARRDWRKMRNGGISVRSQVKRNGATRFSMSKFLIEIGRASFSDGDGGVSGENEAKFVAGSISIG